MLAWFDHHGRKDLPWQKDITPYRVWVSEIMLQQTQVKTVIPYYNRFIKQYPDVNALANSSVDMVLSLWTGLGYYARARNLHKTAQIIEDHYKGFFPSSIEQLIELPGIGLSTAGAILSLSMGKSSAILDGNCKRVYARCFTVPGYTGTASVTKELWELARKLTPIQDTAKFNQAMMDLGSTICRRSKPDCIEQADLCPLSKQCQALQTNSVLLFPEKKKSKKIPEKSAVFLILFNHKNEVFLEKRPPSGIWGGLWCFPQFTDEAELLQYIAAKQSTYYIMQKIKKQQHVFSHFRLNYTVTIIKSTSDNHLLVRSQNEIADNENNYYFSIENSLQLGLATPIKKLLLSL